MKQSHQQNINLDALVNDLPKEIKPENDLWLGIEKQLTPQQGENRTTTSSKWRTVAIAASLMLVSLIGLQQWFYFNHDDRQLAKVNDRTNMANDAFIQEDDIKSYAQDIAPLNALIQQIAANHQAQIDALITSQQTQGFATVNYQQAIETMTTEQQQSKIEKSLFDLRQAADSTQQILLKEPNNQQIWQLWIWILKQELALIKQLPLLPIYQAQDQPLLNQHI
ncbi:hypothetical protein [Shewanella aestuarii]|uniref:Uncharacterized protein n=1 Tax=Shewanella aestuarii TaxID=1028752 RepID=A0A6G9QN04_9GAMM|nr:hypothetical protein [Shewanella aestuarii]QIR15437.1 hypothetical protein HBH39_13785 [Shewanella aestuarii]